jgi:hypothetical protein
LASMGNAEAMTAHGAMAPRGDECRLMAGG